MLASLCGCGLDRLPEQTGWFQRFDLDGHVSLHAGSDGVLLQQAGNLTLLNGEDGARVWTQQIPGEISTNANGGVFSDDGVTFRHYAADSGELVWEVSQDPRPLNNYGTALAANNERVAFARSVPASDATFDCVTFVRDASTGEPVWTHVQSGTTCCGAPAFASNGDVLVVVEDGRLIRYSAGDGTQVEQQPPQIGCSTRIVALMGGGLIIGDSTGRRSVRRLDDSGNVSWEVRHLVTLAPFAVTPDEDVILPYVNVEYGREWNGEPINEGGLRRIAGQTGASGGQAEFFAAPNDVAVDSMGRVFASGAFNVNDAWVAELDWQ
jgi:hypothetical protein